MTLYEIAGDYLALYQMADDPEMDADAWFDTMEGIDEDLNVKAENYCKLIKQMEADKEALKKEYERLYARAKALENNVSRTKERLKDVMIATGKTEIKTDLFSMKVQNNPASVFIPDESRVPVEFLISQAPKIDKKGIASFLKEGNAVDWAELTQSQSLRIR